MITRSQALPIAVVSLTTVLPASYCRAVDVFNDTHPATEALEIWRITNDQAIRHHSNYHNIDPFSPDGRYIIYTITHPRRPGNRGAKRRPPATFAVFDLHARKEVFRARPPALRPIWAHNSNTVYWVRGAHPNADRTLCRLDLSQGTTPSCDDPALRRLAGRVETISFDDRFLYVVGPREEGARSRGAEWVIWQVEPGSPRLPSIVYEHPEFPAHVAYQPRANPTKPVMIARQATLERTATGVRRKPDQPRKFLLDLRGEYLGPVLAKFATSGHLCWSGDGELLVSGDGPLRGRESPFVEPGDWKVLSTKLASDPSPCGTSGQWLVGISGINGQLFVAETLTGYTRLIGFPASIIYQPQDDKRDLSGPYDSDAHGSPDGTKIYFSTNYAMKDFPVTRTLSRIRKPTSGTGPAVLEVESTAGFPESGVLSIWCTLVKYGRKEPTRFLDCEWRYGDTRFPVAIKPGVVVTDYRGRCTNIDPRSPLANQAATDVYIAVVRQPDRPTLVARENRIVVQPGRNHRETAALELYLDGRRFAELPVGTEAEPAAIPEGGRLTVRAVEWSGLESGDSNAIVIEAGTTVVSGREPVAQAPAPKPEVVKKDGIVVERRYLSPEGWPCQVLQYRLDGSLERRRLFRGPDRLFSEEDYAPTGRRIRETIHNREGEVWQWTRFEAGLAVERRHLRYGLFPIHEELKAGRWIRVQP